MSTDLTLTTAAKNAALDAVVDLLDAGSTDANGDIKIYDSGDNLLATLQCNNPAFGAAASGVVTASSITGAAATATGTADYFTACDRDNTEVFRGDVGESGDGAACTLNTVNIVSGEDVSITAFTVTQS